MSIGGGGVVGSQPPQSRRDLERTSDGAADMEPIGASLEYERCSLRREKEPKPAEARALLLLTISAALG
jgi:hypothetical protein